MEPTLKTLKVLFAYSRNECAFPGCTVPIVETDSGTVTGEICHINARSSEGPRYDPEQTQEERHGLSNLLLLCSRHHKIVDTEASRYPAETLRSMQLAHRGKGVVDIGPLESRMSELLLETYRRVYVIRAGGHVMIDSPGAIQGNNVTVRLPRKKAPSITLPPGLVGSDSVRRPYVKYLIDRYAEFAKREIGTDFRYPAFYAKIKKDFKMEWSWVPVSRFEELCRYIQKRVDGTRLGKINRAKGHRNYESFDTFNK